MIFFFVADSNVGVSSLPIMFERDLRYPKNPSVLSFPSHQRTYKIPYEWYPMETYGYLKIHEYIQLYIPYWILYKDTVDMSYPYSSASPQTFFATPSQRPSFFGFCNACKLWERGRFFVSLAAEISERRILIAPEKKHRPEKTNMDTQHECLESR